MSSFSSLMQLFFGWLPMDLWAPVWGILSVAFLVIMIKILTTLVTLITRIIGFFI